jgi:hypothetical protein
MAGAEREHSSDLIIRDPPGQYNVAVRQMLHLQRVRQAYRRIRAAGRVECEQFSLVKARWQVTLTLSDQERVGRSSDGSANTERACRTELRSQSSDVSPILIARGTKVVQRRCRWPRHRAVTQPGCLSARCVYRTVPGVCRDSPGTLSDRVSIGTVRPVRELYRTGLFAFEGSRCSVPEPPCSVPR